MKKKLLLGLLTVSMVLSMAACGGESDSDDDKKNKASVEASTEKESESKEAETKESESKETETKETESKEAETKESESKTAETKEAESKTAETKEAESKTAETKEIEAATNEELIGKWAYSYDGSADLSENLGTEVEFVFDIVMEFKEDGVLGVSVDEESLSTASKNLEDVMLTYMIDTVYAQFAEQGLTKKEADEMFSAAYSMPLEEYCKDTLAAMDIVSMMGDVASQYSYEGAYKVDGDKLYVVESADEAFASTYEVFRIEGDTLILESADGSEGQLGSGIGYPMELKRK